MNAQLREVVAELDGATRRFERLVGGIDEARWRMRPSADAWAAAECVAHLNLTHEAYLPRLLAALEAAFVPGGDQPLAEVSARFRELQKALVAFIEACDGHPIDRVEIPSPFSSAVRFNLWATLLIIARHQHRHLQQAEEAALAAQCA
ncbi:MAG: DinB family protein [Longimicrobiales bacterium]|nr:DinB family protein [Longimicrobiales bacterium]